MAFFQLIDKETKIVFTNSANQQYSKITEWKENPNRLLINSRYKGNKLCSGLDKDKANYHRCLNDYTISRISYVLYGTISFHLSAFSSRFSADSIIGKSSEAELFVE